jgi:hypothetical protein
MVFEQKQKNICYRKFLIDFKELSENKHYTVQNFLKAS